MLRTFRALLYSVLLVSISAAAQTRRPSTPPTQDGALTPVVKLSVDASDAPRKIFHSRMTLPAHTGDTVYVYPKWIPGEHGPTGPIDDVAGLKFTAGGQTLTWHRDNVEMYAFHVDVPAGVAQVEASMDYLSPADASGFSSGASASAKMTVVSWNQVLLYPANTASDKVQFQSSLKLPAGWKFGTALPVANQSGETIDFQPVSLTTLVDSPVIAGEYYKAVQLTPGQTPSHEIDMASDSPAALEMSPETLRNYKQLIAETGALYGSRHYRDYHFLLSLSDYVAHFGLEHHESSDDRVAEHMLTDPSERRLEASLLPHEMTHSWNGKYRRPAGLATPSYQEPMKGELLWVYEGLTEYLGDVLAARSGLWTPEEYRDNLAHVAAYLGKGRPGRTWRPLIDTTTAAQLLYNAPGTWASWRRSVDFYDEGELIWLDADVTIRQLTQNKKSLDDFVHLFHGPGSMTPGATAQAGVVLGPPELKPYTFDDVVNAMNQVVANDWRKFFNDRMTSLSAQPPLGGVENGGYRLVYDDTPGELASAREGSRHEADASFSIGLILNDTGAVGDALIGGLAYQAGMGPGMRVIAVNGRKFSTQIFNDAIAAAEKDKAPIELLAESGEYYKTFKLDYHDGKRYPHIVRDSSKPDLIGDIIKQHAPSVAPPEMKMEIVH